MIYAARPPRCSPAVVSAWWWPSASSAIDPRFAANIYNRVDLANLQAGIDGIGIPPSEPP
ncbi:MAG: hypothetical protein AUH41_11885 [Gemmatimonadetes bacterium 13_1_40CM_66_11]|nr:MAG: hypothetical protein AUH41_11885 [Gemmatimonadetes bacterium 13_1_40CM_66_11]